MPFKINHCIGKIYNYNRNYFKNIDTPTKAYWVGFIVGDGYVKTRDKHYLLRFTISKKDIQQLYNLIDEIHGDYAQIKKYDDILCHLLVTSKNIYQDLIKLGIPSENKTFTAVPISTPYPSAFWLGLFDADGSVGINKSYIYKSFRVHLCGTKEICGGFSNFLGYDGKYVYKNGKIWVFSKKCAKDCKKVYSKLYKYNILCLERKKTIFEGWMDAKEIQY